jgi:hypothetical protein
MNDMQQVLIGQIVADISAQAAGLDELRLRMFMKWLKSHSSQVREAAQIQIEDADCLQSGLKAWFGSLPLQGLLWEYRLLLTEIAWWRDLDPVRVASQSAEKRMRS